MAFKRISLPRGWPWSTWFFIITAIVFLLQLFPYTGVFLMIVGGPFWSIILINLGMVGIVLEAITFRVFFLWLAIPAAYFGGYYLAYAKDQAALALVKRGTVAFNRGKALPFDPARQDFLVEDPKDGLGLGAGEFVERYGLTRAFDSRGNVFMIGAKETCDFIRDKPVFLSAGIQAHGITREGASRWRRQSTGFCRIMMPGKPDRPLVRLRETAIDGKQHGLPVALREYRLTDASNSVSTAVRGGRAGPLKNFPMPAMGCALNSGAPAWQCFWGFMRDDRTAVLPGQPKYGGGMEIVAGALGLAENRDLAARAIGPERFKPLADKADAELVAKEVAVLEKVLADPLVQISDGYSSHLPNKPDVLAPYAPRIFAALQQLQSADHRGNAHGRDLWNLAAALPDEALAPHRPAMLLLMQPGSVREWTTDSNRIWKRLDAARPAELALLLPRIEAARFGFDIESFCRMGAAVPADAKRRLLAKWRQLGQISDRKERHHEDIVYYLALARMGLKAEAGKVDQRYMGDHFRGIWNEVTPATPADICALSGHELGLRYRRR